MISSCFQGWKFAYKKVLKYLHEKFYTVFKQLEQDIINYSIWFKRVTLNLQKAAHIQFNSKHKKLCVVLIVLRIILTYSLVTHNCVVVEQPLSKRILLFNIIHVPVRLLLTSFSFCFDFILLVLWMVLTCSRSVKFSLIFVRFFLVKFSHWWID